MSSHMIRKDLIEIDGHALMNLSGNMIGGVAEGRTTVFSDIDILIVAKEIPRDKKRLYVEILERAIDSYGLPWDAPVEFHIVEEKDVERYMECLGKRIEIKTGQP